LRSPATLRLAPVQAALALLGLFYGINATTGARIRVIGFCAAAALGTTLATNWPAWLWSGATISESSLQPSHALVLPTLFVPLLAVPLFKRWGPTPTGVTLAILIAFSLLVGSPTGYTEFDDDYYSPARIAENGLGTTPAEEWEPRQVERRPPYSANPFARLPQGATVAPLSTRTARTEFAVASPSAGEAELATFYYPGWEVHIDGMPVAVRPTEGRGTIAFILPAGEHRVVAQLRGTSLRRSSLIVSIASLLCLVPALFVRVRRSPHHRSAVNRAEPP
jgi:hypothetical protein